MTENTKEGSILNPPEIYAARVEAAFRKALDIDPRHPWHHGRLVTFLITRGRLADARTQWAQALNQFSTEPTTHNIYVDLHWPVAGLLLHRGQLDFAREVLDNVSSAAQESGWFQELSRLYTLLDEADRDESVFPPIINFEVRWEGGPHLLGSEKRALVKSWMPGRIAAIDDQVHIRVCRKDGGEQCFDWVDMPLDEFVEIAGEPMTTLGLEVGRFVEIIEFNIGLKPKRALLIWPPST